MGGTSRKHARGQGGALLSGEERACRISQGSKATFSCQVQSQIQARWCSSTDGALKSAGVMPTFLRHTVHSQDCSKHTSHITASLSPQQDCHLRLLTRKGCTQPLTATSDGIQVQARCSKSPAPVNKCNRLFSLGHPEAGLPGVCSPFHPAAAGDEPRSPR